MDIQFKLRGVEIMNNKSKRSCEKGDSIVEYVILLATILLVMMPSIGRLSDGINRNLNEVIVAGGGSLSTENGDGLGEP